MTRYRIVLAALLLAALAVAAPFAQTPEHAPPAATPQHETPAGAPQHEAAASQIDMRLRVAKRELLEVGANLAVNVASDRIRTSITTDDQTRLVDRYASQIGTGRGEARQ